MQYSLPCSLFPFRKRPLPFLRVDATIGNQAFSYDRCDVFPGLNYRMKNDTFMNGLRNNDDEAQRSLMEMAWVTCY